MENEKKKIAREKLEKEKYEEELVSYIQSELERRREERLSLEKQWELNLAFARGKQYSHLTMRGEIVEEEKEFYWQKREVFNHIAPILEARQAKLEKLDPILSVKPMSNDDKEITNASLAEKLLSSTLKKIGLKKTIKEGTAWAEITGTAFYKIMWDANGGLKVGESEGKSVYEGEVEIVSVSPFEIFPDGLDKESLDSVKSLIQVKVMGVEEIYELYKKEVSPDSEKLTKYNGASGSFGVGKAIKEKSATVIEYYEKPTEKYPEGRLITVSGKTLLYYGSLPYINGKNSTRIFPFARQVSIKTPGAFFGQSIVERLIPVQRAFNAVKNRKLEFLNRLSTGVLTVEDGSVDTDELLEEGLSPGKVIVYRQGSNKPELMSETKIPEDFIKEEERLLDEFVIISGVSDVSASAVNATVSSGSALELLVEQDNERMTVTAEEIYNCYREIGEHTLRMYKEFMVGTKVVEETGDDYKRKVYFVDKQTVTSDQVSIDNESELIFTETQKKNLLLKLYSSGLLEDANGKVRAETKEKMLELIGYPSLSPEKGIIKLQREKAQYENDKLITKRLSVEAVDNDEIHIEEHSRYLLSEYERLTDDERARFNEHIYGHQSKILDIKGESDGTK